MNKNDIQSALSILQDSDTFLLAGHVGPDGDCLGSMCAVALALSARGKTVFQVVPDGVPEIYKYLPGIERVIRSVPANRRFDAAISVDSDRPDRLGDVAPALALCDKLLVIDHHQQGEWTTGVQLIDTTSASCGEIVYDLLTAAGVTISREIAECLLTAIVTDTGSFRYSNVNGRCLRVAAALIDAGASTEKVAQKVYESRSLSTTKLLGYALTSLTLDNDGTIAYALVTRDMLKESGAADSDTDGIVNYVRSIRGASVGVLFRETDDNKTRVSLRSSGGGLDVAEVARAFGGGGHKAAAGCTVDAPIGTATNMVLEKLRACLAR